MTPLPISRRSSLAISAPERFWDRRWSMNLSSRSVTRSATTPRFFSRFSAAGSRPSTLAANTFCAAERAWCRVTCPYGPMVYLRNFAPAPPAGKERHFVAAPHKLFGQVRNDPLSTAIETRRNALNERSDLRDFHSY
jgi:hypothetical protein